MKRIQMLVVLGSFALALCVSFAASASCGGADQGGVVTDRDCKGKTYYFWGDRKMKEEPDPCVCYKTYERLTWYDAVHHKTLYNYRAPATSHVIVPLGSPERRLCGVYSAWCKQRK